ncbi:putative protein kinase family protein [Phaeomoniella chlamydospora]|uniref:Protein kinase domain-containing protein n=1 Tax=Phaeomoniella chlamydospora TaxID=158046 RepID=A0A0G2EMG9_PHACM|nr:putative protein kinase family protein [Phaeomoniella chlamydospora]
MDFLKSAVASAIAKGSAFPYTFGDRLDNDESIWTLHNGIKKEDKSTCSIFTFDISANRSRLPLAQNAAKKLRTLRHPGIVKVLDTIETDANIYIVTERLSPLSWHVKRKSITEETAKWGLFTIASTLKFVNDDAKSVHGAVRVSSVYTSESGEWKLGGFELLSSMNDEDAVIYRCGTLMPDFGLYAAPEVANGGWTVIKKAPLAATDAYGYGILAFEVFNGSYRGADQLSQLKSIPPSMQQSYKRLVNANPKLRVSPGQFLDQGKRSGGFFETPLIRLTQDVESLGLKNEEERDIFISELDEVSDDFPEDFFKMKVLPELMKSVEFGGGGPRVLAAIIKIGSKLSEDEFESRLLPLIIRLFASPDRAIRVSLLDVLPQVIDRIPQKIVNDRIFPQLVTGFTDTAPVVREQTVKSILTIISKLSDRVINGELLRYLAKTANDEQPGIRTNTTICLGKIARNLGTSSRSKVLVAAFTRALRDPFVHARNAALLALSATIDTFSEDDCATKILPAISPSLMIRDQANKTVDAYLQRIRKHQGTMAESVLPPETTTAVNPASTRMGNQNDTSWAGWAISSFTNKVTTARGEMQSSGNGLKSPPIVDSRPSSVPPPERRYAPSTTQATTSHLTKTIPSASTTQLHTASVTPLTSSFPSSPTIDDTTDDVMDAWGTMDDEGNDDTFFDASSNTKPSVTSPSSTTPTPFDDNGEPDFAGWLAAQSQAKSKLKQSKPLPKGLTKSTSSIATTASRPKANGRASSALKKTVSSTNTTTATSITTKKAIDTKPKDVDEGDEDGGGWDAWN